LRGRRRRRRRRRLGGRCRRRRVRGSRALADADPLDEVRIAARDTHRHGARGLAETTAQRWLDALARLLDEVDVTARDALKDRASSTAFATAARMNTGIFAEVVNEILIARKRLRELQHGIELRPLDHGAAPLPFSTAGRADALSSALDEVDVAARELLRDGAGSLAVGPTVVGASRGSQRENERTGDRAEYDAADEPPLEMFRELQGGPPDWFRR